MNIIWNSSDNILNNSQEEFFNFFNSQYDEKIKEETLKQLIDDTYLFGKLEGKCRFNGNYIYESKNSQVFRYLDIGSNEIISYFQLYSL